MKNLSASFRQLMHYPSALLELSIVLTLIAVAIYAVVAIPYEQAIRLWRVGEEIWYRTRKNAQPVWVNLFRGDDLPAAQILDSREEGTKKIVRCSQKKWRTSR